MVNNIILMTNMMPAKSSLMAVSRYKKTDWSPLNYFVYPVFFVKPEIIVGYFLPILSEQNNPCATGVIQYCHCQLVIPFT